MLLCFNPVNTGFFKPVYPVYTVTPRLRYLIDSAENALVFQVLEQSSDITEFLKKNNFMASNGLRVAIDRYPEFKHSKNVIFLRGSDRSEDFKMDTTRFPSNMERNNVKAMFKQALDELVKVVASHKTYGVISGSDLSYAYPTNPRGNAFSDTKIVIVNR